MRSWLIGSDPDCDLVVSQPTVSWHHCRLSESGGGFRLEDLGSTNGTYVGGTRIREAVPVSRGDSILLGAAVPMPWPDPGPVPDAPVIRIGRESDNEIVLDYPMISGHHARIIRSGGRATIEDLSSTNGTFIGSLDRRVSRAPLSESDTVFFGTFEIAASRLLSWPVKRPDPAPASEVVAPTETADDADALTSLERTPPQASTWAAADWQNLAILLAMAPVLGLLVAWLFGRSAGVPVTSETWTSISKGVASTAFAMGLAAIGMGLCAAGLPALRAGVTGTNEQPIRLDWWKGLSAPIALGGALCLLQCALLLLIVSATSRLGGPWAMVYGLLVLAAWIGLALGGAIVAFGRSRPAILAGSLAALLAMTALGGMAPSFADQHPTLRLASNLMPSRWAFEGLLLMEADRRPTWAPPSPDDDGPVVGNREGAEIRDMAESTFPAETDRMGVKAVFLALGGMLATLLSVLNVTRLVPSWR